MHVRFSENGQAVVAGADLLAEQKKLYYVDARPIGRAFASAMPAHLADLVDLAVAVYMADRVVPRSSSISRSYPSRWTRRFEVDLPLRLPERWTKDLVQRLTEVLWLFTEDEWQFKFGRRAMSECQPGLFHCPVHPPLRTALFSGGLDSFAGLCDDLVTYPDSNYVLLSVSTTPRMGAAQRHLGRAVRARMGREIIPVVVPLGRRQHPHQSAGEERTQRSLGFLFTMLGAATAIISNARSLAIFENGIGALNLPYTEAQLGLDSTRATNPLALVKMGVLISSFTGEDFKFELPHLFKTKGQLCSCIRDLHLEDLIGKALSCDGFQRVAGRPQCGVCTSCLLRRASLHAAGLSDFDSSETYRYDVVGGVQSILEQKLYSLQVMDRQATCFETLLSSPDAWQALSRAYPALIGIAEAISAGENQVHQTETRLLELFRQYCREWKAFAALLSDDLEPIKS